MTRCPSCLRRCCGGAAWRALRHRPACRRAIAHAPPAIRSRPSSRVIEVGQHTARISFTTPCKLTSVFAISLTA